MADRPLAGRIALVTGASRGIGRAAAKGFAMAGATVVAVARTEGALTELDDELQLFGLPPLVLAPLDLADGDRVDQMASLIAQRFGRLDVLVAAAAQLGGLGPVPHFDPPAFQRVVALNLTAQWRLLRAADPLLRRSDAGRAIFLTSTAARLAPAYWGPYAASKAGLEALVRTYAAEVEATTAIRANLLDPGAVRTRMRAEAFPGEDPSGLPDPETLLPTLLRLAAPECSETGQIVSP
ncbi:3-oxoacyl-(Acyl-carrier-protein) reductase [uncultured Alphaproteobacteria bacterium]|uniref:3-oxoacyl-(Acyl-carrier-protein) reductase n=1 Tax=uncultured Alphaproteobacteria bacterium TaxID=91750 RepID=A0A212KL62_9PROT|nr:3-oxoacyl-(Acyl-carrier-protein) reductase [uncultured Alphaproteobacteria bacterium]